MKIFTAHLHPRKPPVLVREAFSWGALLFGPLWLLRPCRLDRAGHQPGDPGFDRHPRAAAVAPPCWRCACSCCSASSATICAAGACPAAATRSPMSSPGASLDDAFFRLLTHRPDLSRSMIGTGVMMRVAVVDYGSGNLTSAARALARAADPARHRRRNHRHRRPGRGGRRRPRSTAGAGRVRRLRRRTGGCLRHAPGDRPRRHRRPSLPRHLRRHAAHGRARAGNTRSRRASAGSAATWRRWPRPGCACRKWAGTRSSSNRTATPCWPGCNPATTPISCTATPCAARARPT